MVNGVKGFYEVPTKKAVDLWEAGREGAMDRKRSKRRKNEVEENGGARKEKDPSSFFTTKKLTISREGGRGRKKTRVAAVDRLGKTWVFSFEKTNP